MMSTNDANIMRFKSAGSSRIASLGILDKFMVLLRGAVISDGILCIKQYSMIDGEVMRGEDMRDPTYTSSVIINTDSFVLIDDRH